jgi:hypothetical protein
MGLYDDPDPIMGKPDAIRGTVGAASDPSAGIRRNFTIPDSPVRRRLVDLPTFVEVRGGAYFFFPGIRALRFIAS